jgi:hypothetical protein
MKKNIECLVCSKLYKSKAALLYHLRNVHAQPGCKKGSNWNYVNPPTRKKPQAKKWQLYVVVPIGCMNKEEAYQFVRKISRMKV